MPPAPFPFAFPVRVRPFARTLTLALLPISTFFSTGAAAAPAPPLPNVVVIFADDLGYGDLGCYGAEGYTTPHLDQMAAEGVKMERFYVAQPVCSASRMALLTGCYPNRVGFKGALGPGSKIGIHPEEVTLAEMLRQQGYATAAFGKWHLGDAPEALPVHHGFDEYLGLPYSNDMWPYHPELVSLTADQRKKRRGYPVLPLIEGDRVVLPEVTAVEQTRLTTWYTQRAVKFIQEKAARKADGAASAPFFLYLAHSMPHVPLYVSEKFQGKTARGLYGDVIMEIDWSVGQVLRTLKEQGIDENTLVIFTSDNGPWLSYGDHSGSSGRLREGKGTVWEGGVRVPCVARWPGKIPAGAVVTEPSMTIDLLPTLARLTGAPLPARKIDGKDVWPLLSAEKGARSPQEAYYFYYHDNELQAVMSGPWKLYFPHGYRTLGGQPGGKDGFPAKYEQRRLTQPELYHLEKDPSETTDVAAAHPEEVARLTALAETAREDLGDSLTKRPPTNARRPWQAVGSGK